MTTTTEMTAEMPDGPIRCAGCQRHQVHLVQLDGFPAVWLCSGCEVMLTRATDARLATGSRRVF